MKLIFTWAIFLIVMILHIIAIIFMIKKFLKIDKTNIKKSPASIITGIISVIINCIIGYIAFCYAFNGLLLMVSEMISYIDLPYSNHPPRELLNETVYICNFIKGLLFFESAIFLPYGLNLLLYKLLYKKIKLSKWVIFPSIIIEILIFMLCVFWIIISDYINKWATSPWLL